MLTSTTDPVEEVERVMALAAKVPSMPKPDAEPAGAKTLLAGDAAMIDGKTEAETEKPEPPPVVEPEAGDEPKAEGEGEDKPKRPGGFQRRIYNLERENEALKAKLAGNAGTPQAEQAEPVAPPTDKPKIEDYDSLEAYTEAVTDWKYTQREQEREAKQAHKAVLDTWEGRKQAARGKYADFDEALATDVPINPAMESVLLNSEAGAEIAYWLGSNPKESERIARMGPIDATREMLRLESKLSVAPAKEAPKEPVKRASAAPEPIKPVGGRATVETDPDKMSFAEYKQWRANGGGKAR